MIEKGIPIPGRGAGASIYRFAELKPGDSILWKGDYDCLRTAAYKYNKRHGTRIVVRKVADGYRYWRQHEVTAG